jgi:hypothetical protein
LLEQVVPFYGLFQIAQHSNREQSLLDLYAAPFASIRLCLTLVLGLTNPPSRSLETFDHSPFSYPVQSFTFGKPG